LRWGRTLLPNLENLIGIVEDIISPLVKLFHPKPKKVLKPQLFFISTKFIGKELSHMNPLLIINWIAFLMTTLYGLYLFGYVVRTRYQFIKLGKKSEFDHNFKARLYKIWVNVFGQKKLLKDKKSGIIHVMMFYGFLLVQLGAIDFIWRGLKPGSHLPLGGFYHYFSFSQELVSFMILAAVIGAFYRRYIEKLDRLKRGLKSGLVLIFIAGLMLSVLLGNGMELIKQGESVQWSVPIASIIAYGFSWIGLTAASIVFYMAWWVHVIILLTFLVYVPQSKHAHLIVAPINIYLNRLSNPGKLEIINFDDETQESFGVGKIEDFTQKQMIDLYACVECGRCTNVCPAASTGKILSPMHLIMKLRDHLTEKGAAITSNSRWVPALAFTQSGMHSVQASFKRISGWETESAPGLCGTKAITNIMPTMKWQQSSWLKSEKTIEEVQLIGDVITEDEIWACTTCRNCEDQCPVMNEHVDKIIDLRRHLVLTEGKVNPEAQRSMTNIERQGNPWGINRKDRELWREGRDDIQAPSVEELNDKGEAFEYLFWVGSMGSYDNRSQKIAQSFTRLMNEAGIKFAILGNKESNSGDTPRRFGNEFLFQELAQKNIAEFQKYGVSKIVTIDPHAYNSLKNEYPDLGFKVEVFHHTELLAQWLREGKLQPKFKVNETITYHDSCYLGRYNQVYDPPRDILKVIPGVTFIEMDRNRENGMCCGAGGGLMWMEEKAGKRVNIARTEQALEVKPTVISSGCPYCLTMLSDGIKSIEVENSVQALDVVELLERSVIGNPIIENMNI
jgi:Fe-S oxidoreductase